MRYFVWILRLIVFLLVLLFALKNTGLVDINFYADHVIKGVPLIVVMLVAFVVGVLFGLLAVVPAGMRRRREIKKLKRELTRLQDSTRDRASPADAVALESVVPLAPM